MPYNRGKQFELKVKSDWHDTMPDSFLLRLPDQISGYKTTSQNPCDFIGFKSPRLFLIECKSIKGNTLPFTNMKQYDRMLSYTHITDLFAGFLVWWVEHDVVAWIPIETVTKLKKENKKSVNVSILEDNNYVTYTLSYKKKKVFLDCDFSILMNIEKTV